MGTLYCQHAPSFRLDVKPRFWLSVGYKKYQDVLRKRVGVLARPNSPIGLLIIPIHRLAASLCLLSTSKLVCGGRSGALWLPSHHPGGCCTLMVDEEIPPLYVKRFECLEKRYINVTNYYYYKCSKFLKWLLTRLYEKKKWISKQLISR